jgi:hypothetical protein
MTPERESCVQSNLHIVSRPTGFEVEDHLVLSKTIEPHNGHYQIKSVGRERQHSRSARTFRYYGQSMDSKYSDKGCCSKVIISSSVSIIPAEAFSEWTTLEHVLLEYPSQLQHIGDQAFFGCTSLVSIFYHDDDDDDDDDEMETAIGKQQQQQPQLPETLTTIGDGAFYKCISMKTFCLPVQSSRLLRVGRTAFGYCEKLEAMVLPDSVEQLGAMAFFGCDALRDIRLSPKLVEIEERTFLRCNSLTEIIIPPSVQVIGAAAFGECCRLERIRLPTLLERLEDSLFDHCTKLTTIDFHDSDDLCNGTKLLLTNNDTEWTSANIVSKTPYGRSGSNTTTTSGKSKESHSTATTSATTAFSSLSPSLTSTGAAVSATLAASFWDDNCFYLPPYLKSIGDETFSGCHKLQNIFLPLTIQTIGNFAFDGCHWMVELALPESTKQVGDGCFRDCKRLETVKMAFDSDVTFGSAAFSGCTSMKELFDPRHESIVYI